MYKIEVTPAADRDFGRLKSRIRRQDLERLRSAISGLAQNPRPLGVRKIKGSERAYRIRVGSYRVVYEIFDDENVVLLIQVVRRTETTYR